MSTIVPEPDKRPLPNTVPSQGNVRPETLEQGEVIVLHASALAYLRTMWSLLWTAFRHPLTTTYIDATTGEVLYGYGEEN